MQTKISCLCEIPFRVNEIDSVQKFYQNIIGLQLIRRFDNAVFFGIADGFGGHKQVLALFDRSSQLGYTGPSA